MTLNLGIITPVLSLRAGGHAAWERDAGIEDVRVIAEAADQLGYRYMSCSEHIALPAEAEQYSGVTYWDPLATFGYLSAFTSRIRFATIVLVLPYHHPLDIAKKYGTLDKVCGGRLIIGVGAGYAEKEFAALGVPFHGRGEVTDDAIRALRASFGVREPSYYGTHFSYGNVVVDPCGMQERVPLWVGGMSRRSLRRAVELGDTWAPFAVSPAQVGEWLALAAKTDAWQRREAPLEVTLVTDPPVDPLGAPKATAAVVRELRDAGANTLGCRFVNTSRGHYLDQLEAMASLVAGILAAVWPGRFDG
jgi:probable F420-dependent oxidoreductase